jgi:hypothetical protein
MADRRFFQQGSSKAVNACGVAVFDLTTGRAISAVLNFSHFKLFALLQAAPKKSDPAQRTGFFTIP